MRSRLFHWSLILVVLMICRDGVQAQKTEEKLPEEAPLVSPGKTFSIVRVDRDNHENAAEKMVFTKAAVKEVALEIFPWRGLYYVSPDDRWILRDQKIGSGESEAILYRVEANGRVSQVVGFNDRLWFASDAVSRLKKKDLYHTGLRQVTWAADSKVIVLKIVGSHDGVSGDGIQTLVTCDIVKNTFFGKPAPDHDE